MLTLSEKSQCFLFNLKAWFIEVYAINESTNKGIGQLTCELTTLLPQGVELNYKRTTSPKGGKDWALVTLSAHHLIHIFL